MKTTDRLNMIQNNITAKSLVDVGYPVFVKHTPVKTGYAVRHTTKSASSINAAYPYAKWLDEGHSRQHTEGMSGPAITAMRDYVTKTLGK
jgi:hypothetical protein